MKKRFTLFSGMVMSVIATMSAVQANTPFVEEPGDGELSTWGRHSMSVVNIMGMDFTAPDYGGAVNMVTAEDGTVWIDYFISSFRTNGWTVGKIDGDKLTISLPQEIYQEDGIPFYLAVVDKISDNSFTTGTETEVVFTMENGIWKSPLNTANKFLGLVTSNGTFTGAGDYQLQFQPYKIPENVNDEGVEYDDYSFICGQSGHIMQIGTKDNQMYFKGLLNDSPDNVIVGEMQDEKITIKSGQYLGISNDEGSTPHYNFFMGVDDIGIEEFIPLGSLDFFRDSDEGVIETQGSFVYNHSPKQEFLNFSVLCEQPRMVLRNDVGRLVPANPTSVTYDDSGYEASAVAIIPQLSTTGVLLDAEQLYYRVYVDGELFTFYNDEYKYLDMQEMTDVPYSYTEQYDFMTNGTYHEIYFYIPNIKVIGVQSVYITDEGETVSDIINSDGTKIDGVKSVNVDTTPMGEAEYFDLHGLRVKADSKGIIIKRQRNSDGNIINTKLVK